ncbi:MAG: MFS transporter [Actinomycetota bacterium]
MTMALLPPTASPLAGRLIATRAIRGFADGWVAVLLPSYLLQLGFGAVEVGVLATATMLGSAALTLAVGLGAHTRDRRQLLLAATALMALTGLGFAAATSFWPLLLIGFVGTLNPSSGDVSVFLPLEQATLAGQAAERDRTALFARYTVAAQVAGAVGALAAAAPQFAAEHWGMPLVEAQRAMFLLYAALAGASALLYRGLPPMPVAPGAPKAPLGPSKHTVHRLAALFSLDSFGGGFVVQSLLALWLFQRFGMELSAAAALFFWSNLLMGISQLLAVPLAKRIGLVNTMVFTHLPANACLVAAAFAPTVEVAVALLLVRAALSQMDVPTRTSYVMAVVSPPERPAAASLTAVPRSLAAAASPAIAGALLAASPFGWPLVLAGGAKIAYDLALLAGFRHHKPPEEKE